MFLGLFLIFLISCDNSNRKQKISQSVAPCSITYYKRNSSLIYSSNKLESLVLDTLGIENVLKKFKSNEISKLLECCFYTDQIPREVAENVNKDSSSLRRKKLLKVYPDLDEADKINQLLLEIIVKLYGWPTSKLYSTKAMDASYLIVIHGSTEFKMKYIQLIEKSIQLDTQYALYYAIIKDKILMEQSKKQLYGTHGFYDHLGKITINPIENIDSTICVG